MHHIQFKLLYTKPEVSVSQTLGWMYNRPLAFPNIVTQLRGKKGGATTRAKGASAHPSQVTYKYDLKMQEFKRVFELTCR